MMTTPAHAPWVVDTGWVRRGYPTLPAAMRRAWRRALYHYASTNVYGPNGERYYVSPEMGVYRCA